MQRSGIQQKWFLLKGKNLGNKVLCSILRRPSSGNLSCVYEGKEHEGN